DAEQPVIAHRDVVREAVPHRFPIAAIHRAPELGDRGLTADPRRLAREKSRVYLFERRTAVVGIESDARPVPSLGVALVHDQPIDLERPIGSVHEAAVDREAISRRGDRLEREPSTLGSQELQALDVGIGAPANERLLAAILEAEVVALERAQRTP